MNRHRFLRLVVFLLLAAVPLMAQETTSSIQGTVTDPSGAVLPGVTVEAKRTNGGASFSTTSDSDGRYRFPAIPPGQYTITASLQGMESASVKNVEAKLGGSPKVDLQLRLSAVAETISVTAEAPLVDVTSSAVATSVTREQIEVLPRGRDFTDVVAFTPGAINDSVLAGGISIDGASGLENRFIIDGIDTTDPQIGSSSVPMRADFMQEVQVKTAGYAAEYGGSTGGVINAVTRTGTNAYQGGLIVDYENNNLNEDRPALNYGTEATPLVTNTTSLFTLDKDDRTRWDPGVFAGGPILRDRLWFFGSYQPGITNVERTVQFPSVPCTRSNGTRDPRCTPEHTGPNDWYQDTYKQESTVNYSTLNLTAAIGSKLHLKAGFAMSPYETEGGLPSRFGRTTTVAQSSYATGTEGDRETYSANADFVATPSLVFSGRGGYYKTNAQDVGIPFFDIIHGFSTGSRNGPSVFPEIPSNLVQPLGFSSNPLFTAAQARDLYERTSGAVDSTYFFRAGGEHAVKAGFQTEKIENDVAVGYNADRILYYWDTSYTTSSGQSVRGKYGYFRLLNISEFGEASSTNNAIFLQDAWSVRPNLTLNIGVRAEHERVPNYGNTGPEYAIDFAYGDKIAPRLGFAWDVMNNGQWKVYGSYGTYYDVMKYEMPRGSFGGNKWVDFFYTLDDFDWTKNNASTCRTGSNTTAENPVCPAGKLIELLDRRHNAADPHDPLIQSDMKPMEQWEAQVGLDRQIGNNMRAGLRLVHKELVRAIDDIGFLQPGVGEVYHIANPGSHYTENLASRPFPGAVREYDAAELTFERRFADRFSVNASYTYSRLYGNYAGLASADEQNALGDSARLSPNVSRYYDHILTSFDRNGEVVYGRLPTDRPHQFKAQVTYQFPFEIMAAVNQYIGSGTPVTEFGLVPAHNFFMPYGRGNMGRTPTLTQTDLNIAKTFSIGRTNLQIGANILNLFDEDTVTRYWTVRVRQDLPLNETTFFAGGWNYETLAAASNPDPAFGQPDNFQAGRQVRLNMKFTF